MFGKSANKSVWQKKIYQESQVCMDNRLAKTAQFAKFAKLKSLQFFVIFRKSQG